MTGKEHRELVDELWRVGRIETAKAHQSNMLADVLHQSVFPALSRLHAAAARASGSSGPGPEPLIARVIGRPTVHELLDQLPGLVASAQDAQSARSLLNSWRPVSSGPASAARVRQHQPTDAWSEEMVHRAIETHRASIESARVRVGAYVEALQDLIARCRAAADAIVPAPEWARVVGEVVSSIEILVPVVQGFARTWGVSPR